MKLSMRKCLFVPIAVVLAVLVANSCRSQSNPVANAAAGSESKAAAPSTPAQGASRLPRPDHIVIVIEENKGYDDVMGSPNAPYLNSLPAQGANLAKFSALHHPSQPNYIELFSGNNQGVFNDNCLSGRFSAPSLGGSLTGKKLTFAGYAEDLPADHTACVKGYYARKHCPWIDFDDVPDSSSKPFTEFPTDDAGFAALPTVAIVIPNLVNDMHSLAGTNEQSIPKEVANGDDWLKKNLDAYARWAQNHNSLLIVTWDEDSGKYVYPLKPEQKIDTPAPQNRIPTLLIGQMVKPGAVSDQQYTFYDLLRTVEDMYGLPLLGGSEHATDIEGIWK